MLATPSDFLVNTGDVVDDGGSAADWQAFFQIEQPLLRDRALFLCVGNHELYDDQAGANFARYFGFPDRDRHAPALRDDALGQHAPLLPQRHARLERAARSASGSRRSSRAPTARRGSSGALAVVHHGPVVERARTGATRKLLDGAGPGAARRPQGRPVLAGHDHIYERGEHGGSAPLKYVTSGGGGAPLYPIEQPAPTTRKVEPAYHFVEVTLTQDACASWRIASTGRRSSRAASRTGNRGTAIPRRRARPRRRGPGPGAGGDAVVVVVAVRLRGPGGAGRAGGGGGPRARGRGRRSGAPSPGLIVAVRRPYAGGDACPRSLPRARIRPGGAVLRRPARPTTTTWPAAQKAYEASEHERALAIFRSLEPDTSRLTETERAHYAYLRGMTDYRMGYKAESRHWLSLAAAIEAQTPGSLPPEWQKRLTDSLKEMNEEVYAGGIEALSNNAVAKNKGTEEEPAGGDGESHAEPEPPRKGKPKPAKNDDE